MIFYEKMFAFDMMKVPLKTEWIFHKYVQNSNPYLVNHIAKIFFISLVPTAFKLLM